MIRNIEENDHPALKEIHAQFFANEFTFEDFLHGAMASFLFIDDSDGSIISACCVRPIAEMVALTNMSKSPRMRRNVLYDALQIASFMLRDTNMKQLHAFVQDKVWESQLIRAGFNHCAGKPLYINIKD